MVMAAQNGITKHSRESPLVKNLTAEQTTSTGHTISSATRAQIFPMTRLFSNKYSSPPLYIAVPSLKFLSLFLGNGYQKPSKVFHTFGHVHVRPLTPTGRPDVTSPAPVFKNRRLGPLLFGQRTGGPLRLRRALDARVSDLLPQAGVADDRKVPGPRRRRQHRRQRAEDSPVRHGVHVVQSGGTSQGPVAALPRSMTRLERLRPPGVWHLFVYGLVDVICPRVGVWRFPGRLAAGRVRCGRPVALQVGQTVRRRTSGLWLVVLRLRRRPGVADPTTQGMLFTWVAARHRGYRWGTLCGTVPVVVRDL